jgi:hypothetical protein
MTRLGRHGRGTKAARASARDAKALRHELRADFDPDKVDLEEIKSYCKAFPVYLRKHDKGLQRGISPAAATTDDAFRLRDLRHAGSVERGIHHSPRRAGRAELCLGPYNRKSAFRSTN